ncbi:MAG: cytochrome c biogenesis CcdA family protein, partial [Actinomycetota bacterium]
YAFAGPRQLLGRTALFYAGLVTLLVPLGMGLGAISGFVNANRPLLITLAGVALVALGLVQILGRGFGVPGLAGLPGAVGGDSPGAVYLLGVTYAFAGFCSGPILGAVLTVAATSGTPARGAALLAVYALGMAAPAFALALAWDRLGGRGRMRLRGRTVTLAGREVHTTSLVSGLLFVGVGLLFLLFEGTVGLTGLYQSAGASDLAARLDATVRALSAQVPDGLVVAAALLGAGLLGWRAWRRRGAEPRASEPESDPAARQP